MALFEAPPLREPGLNLQVVGFGALGAGVGVLRREPRTRSVGMRASGELWYLLPRPYY